MRISKDIQNQESKKNKKSFDIRITRDRKVKTLHLNQFYYINEVLDRLQMFVNKSNSIELSINEYNSFRFNKSKNERIN